MKLRAMHCSLAIGLGLCLLPLQAMGAAALDLQRALFPQAKSALQHDQVELYQRLKKRLRGYPLYPYLEIWEARRALERTGDESQLRTVLQRYPEIPESRDLRLAWIRHLAKREQWKALALQFKEHPELAAQEPTIARLARWHQMGNAELIHDFGAFWQTGGRVTEAMQGFERKWREAGHPSDDERWMRIGAVFRQGRWKEATTLARMLPKEQRAWLQAWKTIANDPERGLPSWRPERIANVRVARMIAEDGLQRLARRDLVLARRECARLGSLLAPSGQQALARAIALRAARTHRAEARAWLAALPDSAQTDETRAWQVRLALLDQDWKAVDSLIARMPGRQAHKARWVYWRAQAMKALGMPRQARKLLASIAEARGYYSFLAARELALPYRFSPRAIQLDMAAVATLSKDAAIQRAHEWWLLNQPHKAAREWWQAMHGADARAWQAAAVLARQWGWHAMAIRAVARAGAFDALDLRFPLAYVDAVEQASRATGLRDSEIWSIIRQESAFDSAAVSRAGARGLMQLMPATASEMARQLRLHGRPDLFDPKVNIRLGSAYLGSLMRRFGRLEYAAAAYNAGPRRTAEWLERIKVEDPRVWVEAIPFGETRRYVQQVVAFRIVYDWRKRQALLERARDRAEREKALNHES